MEHMYFWLGKSHLKVIFSHHKEGLAFLLSLYSIYLYNFFETYSAIFNMYYGTPTIFSFLWHNWIYKNE